MTDPFSDGLALLIVEDDDVLREALREVLTMDGYVVDTAATLPGASAALARANPAIVVLDLMLSVHRTEAILEELLRRPDAPSIVLVSAAADGAAVARRYGVPFLAKPFDLEELSALVATRASSRPKQPPGSDDGPHVA